MDFEENSTDDKEYVLVQIIVLDLKINSISLLLKGTVGPREKKRPLRELGKKYENRSKKVGLVTGIRAKYTAAQNRTKYFCLLRDWIANIPITPPCFPRVVEQSGIKYTS